jgi:type II secretory pathway component GspD/PulD (secretin)
MVLWELVMKLSFGIFILVFSIFAFSQTVDQQTNQLVVSTPELYPIEKIPVPDSVRIPVLDFKNTDIRDVLRGLGMQYNANIFLEPEVTGNVSLYLTDVSVKNAIDFIVKRNNFAYSVENGIIKVYKYSAPPPPPPPKPAVVFHFQNNLLDIDIKSIDVKEVARMFIDSAGINVIVDGSVDKTITARLVKMNSEKAIKALFESNGLAVTTSDGIYYVANQNWGDDKSGAGASSQLKRLSITVKEKKVTLEVDNASLDQVVRTIAIQSGINIVIYDKLTGEISAKLKDVGIDDAIRFLLQNTKFTFWKEREIYFLGSREMNQQKTTIIIPLRHIMADEATITKVLPPTISSNAVVKFNSEHNAIILIGSFDVVAQAQEFIEKVDKPIPQVLIEALVVDFNVNKIRDYGVSLFTQGPKDSSGNWLSEQFLPTLDLKPGRKKTEKILNSILKGIGSNHIVDLPDNFRAGIQALESADVVKVHSTPQIATLNGNQAVITIGETRYYKLSKETTAPIDNRATVIGKDERFEVIKFNTQLQVTPWVMDDGYVMVKIRPEFNIPRTGGDGSTPPNVDTRVIESMVRLRDGQTIILGGQRQTENVVSSRGIPLLSSIPVLGWLFSSRTISKNETQMMIFLTPHVYYGDDNAVSPDDYFGKELNKILNKYDIDKKDKVKEDKQQEKGKRRSRKAAEKAIKEEKEAEEITGKTVVDTSTRTTPVKKEIAKDSTAVKAKDDSSSVVSVEQDKKERKFRWFWKRKKQSPESVSPLNPPNKEPPNPEQRAP